VFVAGISADEVDPVDITRNILMYFILPLWVAAGFADYLCHRAAHIEQTSGVKESILHLLQFLEMGIPILAAMFLEINALVILVMIVFFFFHEVTALWDLSYANATRKVGPIEQHVRTMMRWTILCLVLGSRKMVRPASICAPMCN
jgi:hypothetical protein